MASPKRQQTHKKALTMHPIQLDKESWESVPRIVESSMRIISTNMKQIESWSAYQENDMRLEMDRREELENRLKETDKQLEKMHERLNFLFVYTNSLFSRQQQQSSSISACLRRELGMMKFFFSNFCQSFGVSADKTDSSLVSDTPQESPAVDPGTSKQPEEALEALCTELEGQLNGLTESFSRWKGWRKEEELRSDYLHNTTEELRLGAERTRERLITWRETLKESSHVVHALSSAIVSTQRDVADLKSTQVTRSNVDEVVKKKALELEEVIQQNRANLNDLADGLSTHREDVQHNIEVVQHRMQERIDNHGEEVMGALKFNLNPITSYLNSMHVKADSARAELDDLVAQVPMLQNRIEEVSRSLHESASDSQNRISLLNGRLDSVATELHSHSDTLKKEQKMWNDSIEHSTNHVEARVAEVKRAHQCLQESLDAVQTNRLASLDNGLSTLEQKVAKWVHSTPLPAKISEARLYALESRLLEETNARVHLEAQIQDLPVLLRSAGVHEQSQTSLHNGTVGSTTSLTSITGNQPQGNGSTVSLPKLPQGSSQHGRTFPTSTTSYPTPRFSRTTQRKISPGSPGQDSTPDLGVKKSEMGFPVAL